MRILLIVSVALVIVGCGGDGDVPESESNDLDPVATTERWLAAASDGEEAAIEGLIEPTGLAVIAAIENNLRSDELVALLRDGFPQEMHAQYWSDFASNFALFSGYGLDELIVGGQAEIPGAAGVVQVSVAAGGVEQPVVLRNTADGWQIDYAATVGPTFAGPLGSYLETALGGEHGAEIAAAYRESVVPGLDVALLLRPEDNELVFEAEYIRQLSSG